VAGISTGQDRGGFIVHATLGLLQAVGVGFAAIVVVIVAIFVVAVILSAIKIVKEYERGVIFRIGRVQGGPKGPGLFILLPIVDRMVKIDLRTVTMEVPPQEIITRDNVPARVTAVIYFRVVDPNKSVLEVENHVLATSQIAQTTLRSILGQKNLDDLLTNREEINEELQKIIDEQTEPWGIKVSVVEVKDVEIPQNMQRAMARQAESERERRAKQTVWRALRRCSLGCFRRWARSPRSRTPRSSCPYPLTSSNPSSSPRTDPMARGSGQRASRRRKRPSASTRRPLERPHARCRARRYQARCQTGKPTVSSLSKLLPS
jgi:hypothetical protein